MRFGRKAAINNILLVFLLSIVVFLLESRPAVIHIQQNKESLMTASAASWVSTSWNWAQRKK